MNERGINVPPIVSSTNATCPAGLNTKVRHRTLRGVRRGIEDLKEEKEWRQIFLLFVSINQYLEYLKYCDISLWPGVRCASASVSGSGRQGGASGDSLLSGNNDSMKAQYMKTRPGGATVCYSPVPGTVYARAVGAGRHCNSSGADHHCYTLHTVSPVLRKLQTAHYLPWCQLLKPSLQPAGRMSLLSL